MHLILEGIKNMRGGLSKWLLLNWWSLPCIISFKSPNNLEIGTSVIPDKKTKS